MKLNRRLFLRGAGATIALPPLESFGSGSLLSKPAPSVDSGISNAPVKRLVTIGTYLGFPYAELVSEKKLALDIRFRMF